MSRASARVFVSSLLLCACTKSNAPLDAGAEVTGERGDAAASQLSGEEAGGGSGASNGGGGSSNASDSQGETEGSQGQTEGSEDSRESPAACADPDAAQGLAMDLLFVVDNSSTMREEQALLRAELPKMMRALTSGDHDQDGVAEAPSITDLHAGVVSTDMGLPGIGGIDACAGFGDDGILNNVPGSEISGCASRYPSFLSYRPEDGTPEEAAADLVCLASLGTEGCGFEQQLEAPLKALWPSSDERVVFVGDEVDAVTGGHGDNWNAGFLHDVRETPSVLAIVLLTDEDDCSSHTLRHFTPNPYLDEDDPLLDQELALRCYYNPDNLYDVSRYVNGYKMLREGGEQLVIFGAIVGVPPELLRPQDLAQLEGDEAWDEFYQNILDAPDMEQRPDPTRTPEQGGNLTPSCIGDFDGDGNPDSVAYPPRRIVEVARGFGDNGVLGSICDARFSGALDRIVERATAQLGRTCRP